ncbi:MAG: hypothetical protein H6774_01615 [Pseudomonadales bacterium]|nr:hypothetical protein [Candidatus Woesebacteria bacterium]MCB9801765.1 hypothetical protein [Pseudomonadales bacterium]
MQNPSLSQAKLPIVLPEHKLPLIIATVLASLCSIICILYVLYAQPVLPIFYSLASASAQLAPKYWLLLLPGISVTMLFVHASIARAFQTYSPLIVRLFLWVTVLLQVALLLAAVRIISITL